MTDHPGHLELTTRCLLCAWTHEGTLEDGMVAARTHRVVAHGITAEPKKRKGRSPWSSHTPLADNIANARSQGAAGWASGADT